MPHHATPAEVFHALADGVPKLVLGDASQLDRVVELYAEHTHVVHPFAPFGIDPLLSRDDLRRHFTEGPRTMTDVDSFEAVDRIVHQTADPEVVVCEFRYVVSRLGRTFELPCIFVLRVRDGQIVESRDYVDHLALVRGLGQLESFAGALVASARTPAA